MKFHHLKLTSFFSKINFWTRKRLDQMGRFIRTQKVQFLEFESTVLQSMQKQLTLSLILLETSIEPLAAQKWIGTSTARHTLKISSRVTAHTPLRPCPEQYAKFRAHWVSTSTPIFRELLFFSTLPLFSRAALFLAVGYSMSFPQCRWIYSYPHGHVHSSLYALRYWDPCRTMHLFSTPPPSSPEHFCKKNEVLKNIHKNCVCAIYWLYVPRATEVDTLRLQTYHTSTYWQYSSNLRPVWAMKGWETVGKMAKWLILSPYKTTYTTTPGA